MASVSLARLIKETHRRRVFHTAALYVIAAWVLLQVADLAFPGLDVPESAIRYVWVGVFIGFPIALIFGWRYQMTSEGLVRTAPSALGEPAGNLSLKTTDHALLSVLALVVAGISYGVIGEIRSRAAIWRQHFWARDSA